MQAIQDHLSTRRLRDSFRLAFFLAAIELFMPSVIGQESSSGEKAEITATKAAGKTATDAKALIDALENHNPVPILSRLLNNQPSVGYVARFDKKYDWSENERVVKAIASLVAHAEEAWPELLKHFDDKRYCMTYRNTYTRNYSVGRICQNVVRGSLVEGYAKHFSQWLFSVLRYPRSKQAYIALIRPDMVRSPRKLKTWCEKRKGKQLYELQIEMCEWAITKLTKLDFLNDKEREPFIKAIRAEIEELRKSKKAARFPGFHGPHYGRYDAESARTQ